MLARLHALECREAATAANVERLVQTVKRLEERNRQLELRNAQLARTVCELQIMTAQKAAGNLQSPLSDDAPDLALDGLPDEVLIRVCSFLGVQDLRQLGLVSRRWFHFDQVASSNGTNMIAASKNDGSHDVADLTIIAAGARMRALRQSVNLVVRPPRIDAEETWLHVLRRLEHPVFDDPRGQGRVSDGGMTACIDGGDDAGEVLCNQLQMLAGRHYCEFTIEWGDGRDDLADAFIPEADFGVVGASYDPPVNENLGAAWLFSAINGALFHDGTFADWPGQPGRGEIGHGDVVGLLVDLDMGNIVAFHRRNGGHLRRLGTMMQHGQKNMDGELVAPIVAPLRWAVSLEYGATVRIAAGLPAPTVS